MWVLNFWKYFNVQLWHLQFVYKNAGLSFKCHFIINTIKYLLFFFHVVITYFAERQIPSAGMVKKKRSGWLQMRRRYGFCFSLKPAFRLWAASWRSLDDSQRHTRAISFQLTHVTSGMVTVWGPAQIRKTKPVWWWKRGGGVKITLISSSFVPPISGVDFWHKVR